MKKVLRTGILSHIRHAFLRLESKVTGEVTYPPVLALFLWSFENEEILVKTGILCFRTDYFFRSFARKILTLCARTCSKWENPFFPSS